MTRMGHSAGAGLLAAMLAGCAVTMPSHYLGLPTLAPLLPEERARIETAAAVAEGCPWTRQDKGRVMLPCALFPPSHLAGLAWSGNRHAALELGIRFEKGRGVARDLARARQLYRMAALSTGGTIFTYSPGSDGAAGHMIPIFLPEEPGLPEARARLLALGAAMARPEGGAAP